MDLSFGNFNVMDDCNFAIPEIEAQEGCEVHVQRIRLEISVHEIPVAHVTYHTQRDLDSLSNGCSEEVEIPEYTATCEIREMNLWAPLEWRFKLKSLTKSEMEECEQEANGKLLDAISEGFTHNDNECGEITASNNLEIVSDNIGAQFWQVSGGEFVRNDEQVGLVLDTVIDEDVEEDDDPLDFFRGKMS